MVERKIQSKKRYLLALLIGTAVFIIVFGITYSISYLEYQRISSSQQQTSYSIFEDKLGYSLFDQEICEEEYFKQVSEKLGFQGRIIDDLEKKFGKNDNKVLFRKKFYSLVELEHLEFVKTMNEECDFDIQTILFFYSNEPREIKDSEKFGDYLNTIYRRNPDLLIYSFDINLDSNLIENLKEKYNIEESPTILVNERFKVTEIQNIEDVEKYLD